MTTDWRQISMQYGPDVWKTVRCLVGNEADARDAYQETFLQAYQFSQKSKVENWSGLLKRFARLRAMDSLRKKYRRATVSGSDLTAGEAVCQQPGAEDHLVAVELADRLRVALAQLTPQQSEVFVMRYVEELSYDEIAERTNSNRNAVGVMLSRARAQLQQQLAPPNSKPDDHTNSQEASS